MKRDSFAGGQDPFVPPTDAEKQRVGALLATVSTRTLLLTLASLSQQNEDASLIVAALLDRFPPVEGEPDDPDRIRIR
ncbi:hypothetical protein [Sphingomonas bacterium]|uniref:hypothetical protein n=1 Tax=Sphingomonas bacterium TaxID=1895847 RepID=UPI00157693DB|nr:hypothetical protein [Sphingomonas bacterium]